MVKPTQEKVNDLINQLHLGEHIDDMTKKRLLKTLNLPRIPILYKLTKIHKPYPVGRLIICDGPTQQLYSLEQIGISFIEQIGKDTILVSMDVSCLYRNIPQEEGTEIAFKAYDSFHNYNPPTRFLKEMLASYTKIHSSSMERTISKHMERPKMAVYLPIFSWIKLKQRWYNKAKPSKKSRDDILTISSPSGTVIKKTWIILLNKLTNSTLTSNSRPKNQRTRLL